MGFIAFIATLLVWWHLSSKISFLEKKIDYLIPKKNNTSQFSPTLDIDNGQANSMRPIDMTPIPQPQSRMESEEFDPASHTNGFVEWIKEDFLVKLGGLLVLIAIGWFVSFAFAENWIGPVGRIALGLVAGISVMAFAVYRMNTHLKQGAIFVVLGGAVVIMTLFAAREIYDFFTPTSALLLMFLTVVFIALLSVRNNLESLAYASLIIGGCSPLLTNSPDPSVVGLFSYLIVLTVGTLWVVWQTGWTKLTLLSLLVTFFYSVSFLSYGPDDKSMVMLFTFIFVALYFLTNIISLVRRQAEESKHIATHIATAIATTVFLVVWVENTSLPEWKSLLYTVWALVFCLGTYVVYSSTSNKTAFYLYGAIGLGLIGVATAAELVGGPMLAIAYFIEISALIVAARHLQASSHTLKYLSLLLSIPFLLSLESFAASSWFDGVLHGDFIVLLFGLVAFLLVGMTLSEYKDKYDSTLQTWSYFFVSIGGVYAVGLVWLVTHAIMSYGVATTVSLVTYTVFGLLFYLLGRNEGFAYLKNVGGVLIGGVVLRLVFVDVWAMSLEGRIVTFLIIGVLLISTAFMNKKDTPRLTEN
jgi:uncharacterized membrane protein